ncbi:bis(5'-nucleosyl)-tetraphosphatase (symmetrical) YqeK [Fusobacterium sp. PH5-44]|uniref:bis(5'-nucleosyl)-tetraphosphatase (symmetrical) YqeK n=1 Tax=unclassified Fusobacterium TaxID=2648384 RepID=UPI003D212D7F
MNYLELKKEICSQMSEKRFNHTLGVIEQSVELGQKYNENIEKLKIAALLHDIAKEKSVEYLKEKSEEYYFDELSNDDIIEGVILHSYVGAIIAREKYGIEDSEILDAIKYHTTGKRDLSLFGRIIYISDAIEKNRNYNGVEKIREKVNENINIGIIFEIDHKISYLNRKKAYINKNTIQMRDWLTDKV